MSGLDNVTLLGADFNLPPNVDVIIVDDLAALGKETARVHSPGNSELFGTAFVQGQRLNFTTAMPWSLMLALGVVEQPPKGAQLEEVLLKSNRPKQGAHGANLRRYLRETACANQPFIVPSITMNLGASFGGEVVNFRVTLILVANASKTVAHGASAWSGMLIIPNHIKLHITDGGHRFNQSNELLNDTSANTTEAMKSALKENAIDVRFVFEPDVVQAHQDFADCGRAKPIAASLITAYDQRDGGNTFTTKLVSAIPFLAEHVDATAAGVNLSAKSVKCWPMSAVRMLTETVNRLGRERDPAETPDAFNEVRLDGVQSFVDNLISAVPTLRAINEGWLDVRRGTKQRADVQTAADLRGVRGGDIVLRASFLAIVARAFDYCKETGYDLDVMVKHIAETDWHVLTCTDEELQGKIDAEKAKAEAEKREPEPYHVTLSKNLTPHLRTLVIPKEGRYRLTASGPEIAAAWEMLRTAYKLPVAPLKLAA